MALEKLNADDRVIYEKAGDDVRVYVRWIQASGVSLIWSKTIKSMTKADFALDAEAQVKEWGHLTGSKIATTNINDEWKDVRNPVASGSSDALIAAGWLPEPEEIT